MNNQGLMNAASLIAKRNAGGRVVAATVNWDGHDSKLKVTYYVDGIVSDVEQGLCDLTLTELLAEFPDVRRAESHCLSASGRLGKLGKMQGLVYLR